MSTSSRRPGAGQGRRAGGISSQLVSEHGSRAWPPREDITRPAVAFSPRRPGPAMVISPRVRDFLWPAISRRYFSSFCCYATVTGGRRVRRSAHLPPPLPRGPITKRSMETARIDPLGGPRRRERPRRGRGDVEDGVAECRGRCEARGSEASRGWVSWAVGGAVGPAKRRRR